MFKAYLEDFHDVKIIINNDLIFDENKIYARINNNLIPLFVINKELINFEKHIYLKSDFELLPNIDIDIIIDKVGEQKLFLGRITRSVDFEKKYYFDDWLGYKYDKKKTTFRVWSPVAKEVFVVLNDTEYELEYQEKGVWERTIDNDLECARYHLKYRINDTFDETLDPYAISSSSNHHENYVIDLNKTYKMKYGYYKKDNFKNVDSVIYELSIRDATSKIDVKDKGTFKALTLSVNENYGLGYLKNLGITHLQLMPVFAFGGVDEEILDENSPKFKYNWGYNPMQYMVPSGFYTTDANDPYKRINELKELVDTVHSLNLGVNLDVVYNHVYDNSWYPFEKLVPGYTFRTNEIGYLTNASWCGNDLKTDHLMVRKLITDASIFFQKFYMIDGFRFDLMGLIDVKTIKDLSKTLHQNNHCTMIYGEGWDMNVNLPKSEKASMNNAHKLEEVAFFNDYFRSMIRGDLYKRGYLDQKYLDKEEILKLIKGYTYYGGEFINASQSINYVECHDNHTLFDLIRIKNKDLNFEQIVDYIKLSLGLVVLSSGIPFIHAGEELLRSKNFIDNSYNKGDDINGINWFSDLSVEDTLVDLLNLRKEIYALSCDKKEDLDKYIKLDKHFSLPIIRFLSKDGTIYQMIISNNYDSYTKFFVPGTYLVYDGSKKVLCNVQDFIINKPGIYIFKK